MTTFSLNNAELAWSLTIALAWILGEIGHRFTHLPRVSIYGLVGFLAASLPIEFSSYLTSNALLLPANIAFGLILFEFGYYINLRWLKCNPWLGITGLLEAIATFIAVYALTQWYGMSTFISLSLAALSMATSPAGVLHVINEQRSSGQVTERILHLSAQNCVLAAITFNVIVAFWDAQRGGHPFQAAIDSAVVLLTSIALGAIFGIVLPLLLRLLGNLAQDTTIAFALSVILLVALTHAMKISPTLAALTFGLMARHRRIALSHTKRNFGPLGNLLKVLLFVFITSTLEWQYAVAGVGLGLAIIAVRLIAKIFVTTAFAPVSGITLRKGFFTGVGLAPVSVFIVLTLAQARYSGLALIDELTTLEALTAITLILAIIGPICTQYALILANETSEK